LDHPKALARALLSRPCRVFSIIEKGSAIMKFETLMLHSLFVACFALCMLVMGAMLRAQPATHPSAGASMAAMLLDAPDSCVLPHDGVLCPQSMQVL
jgi:hypothetical protein